MLFSQTSLQSFRNWWTDMISIGFGFGANIGSSKRVPAITADTSSLLDKQGYELADKT